MFSKILQRIIKIHEPKRKQLADIGQLNPLIARMILKGEDCDKLQKSYGDFGTLANPIPVNGSLREVKYLGSLEDQRKTRTQDNNQ